MTWPTWPFTRLTPREMAELVKAMEQKRRDEIGEALL